VGTWEKGSAFYSDSGTKKPTGDSPGGMIIVPKPDRGRKEKWGTGTKDLLTRRRQHRKEKKRKKKDDVRLWGLEEEILMEGRSRGSPLDHGGEEV